MSTLKGHLFRLAYALGRRLGDRRHILQLMQAEKLHSSKPSPSVAVHSYSSMLEMPDELIDEIQKEMRISSYRVELRSQFDSNATLYVLTFQDRFGSLGWTRYGRDIPKWHIALDDDDAVFSRDFTAVGMRGRGFHAILMAARYRNIRARRCFADCHVNNYASLHALARSGWRIVDRVRVC